MIIEVWVGFSDDGYGHRDVLGVYGSEEAALKDGARYARAYDLPLTIKAGEGADG